MTSHPPLTIRLAMSSSDHAAVANLFTAYANSLPISLDYQNFSHELSSLPGLYAPPKGALLLATAILSDGQELHVGCVALRPLSFARGENCCEMKRLYCVPEARGWGVGRALVTEVLQKAAELGYEEIRLDTLKEMTAAKKLYEDFGFEVGERYYDTPVEGTAFLVKTLGNKE